MGHFLPFHPLTAWKIKLKKKKKKKCLEISSFYICTINYDQMMYGCWDMMCGGCNYFSFWAIFCPFIPRTARKIKVKKTPKKTLGNIIILHICTKNYDQIMYGSWDMVCDRCNCYFSFLTIFCPFTPLTAQKIKL